jgi:galactokinase
VGAVAPGRVNLIGEHTDYNQGFVLPIAIERQAMILAARARENISTIWSADLGEQLRIDLSRPLHPMPDKDANYLLGVVDQFHRRNIPVPNLDLALTSTVPIGAGLSSSAALEVAMATLLVQITGAQIDPLEKALLCQAAEHAFPGAPVGIMDMYVSAMARQNHALLIDCRSNDSRPVPIPDSDEAVLLIVDTRIKHRLAGGEYAQRRLVCESAARKLGVAALRDATMAMLESDWAGLTDDERAKATHVIQENARTLAAAQALEQDDLAQFGKLMFASHQSLRDLFDVSCSELDLIVQCASEHVGDGVFGARMTGGGFGGCAIVLCRPEALSVLASVLHTAFERSFKISLGMFTTGASAAARPLDL